MRVPAVRPRVHGPHTLAAATAALLLASCEPPPPPWIEMAGPIEEGQVEGMPNRPVAGAVTAILAHPQDANKLFVATTNAGVWRTLNATSESPEWTPLMETQASLSISALAFDPFDDKYATIFAATGRFSSGAGTGGPHLGVYRSEDDGETWTTIGAQLAGVRIRGLVAPRVSSAVPGEPVLLAATDNGVMRSTDAGVTFAISLIGTVTSILADPADSMVVWAAVADTAPLRGIYRSMDAGASWLAVEAIKDPFFAATPRIRLAASPVPFEPGGPTVVYAALALGGDASVHRTEDNGVTWQAMGMPATQESLLGIIGDVRSGLFPGEQWRNHFSLAVDPTDPRRVYIGGDRQPRQGVPTASGTVDYSGRLFEGYAVPGKVSEWRPLVGNGANGTSPHADSRFITFDALGNLLEGDDGGIYRLSFPSQDEIRYWQSVNGNLRPTELYSAAWDAHNDNVIAGTQDVGSIEQVTQPLPGTPPQWRDARLVGVFGFDIITQEGDGGTVAVDSRTDPDKAIRYTTANNLNAFFRRDYPVATPAVVPVWLRFVDANGPPGPFGGLHPADSALRRGFIRFPFVLNEPQPSRLAIGGNALYESDDFGFSVRVTDPPRQDTRIAALAYGGRRTDGLEWPGVIYAARGNELSLRDDFGVNWSRRLIGTNNFSTGDAVAIRDIVLDPGNFRTAFLVTRDSVFRIDAAGESAETVTNITGTLSSFRNWYMGISANTSTLDLRTIEIFRVPGRRAALLVGGLGGVFRLLDPDLATPAAIPIWREFGSRLPNVVVTDLRFNAEDDVLLAATFGRGAWILRDAAAALLVPNYRALPAAQRIPSAP